MRIAFFISSICLYAVALFSGFEIFSISASHSFDNHIPLAEYIWLVFFLASIILGYIYFLVGLELISD